MKYFGDISEKDRLLIKELTKLENWFDEYQSDIRPILASKGLLCLAHDYYDIYMEEEGERLIMRAEAISPGYFKGTIYRHIEEDASFAKLIDQMRGMMALDVMISLGFKDG